MSRGDVNNEQVTSRMLSQICSSSSSNHDTITSLGLGSGAMLEPSILFLVCEAMLADDKSVTSNFFPTS